MVGIASTVAVDSYVEHHTHILDCWACPAYLAQLPELLLTVVERARAAGAEALQAYLAESDRAKQEAFQEAGFREEARLRDRLRVDAAPAARQDLLVYHLSLDRRASPAHPRVGILRRSSGFPVAALTCQLPHPRHGPTDKGLGLPPPDRPKPHG